MFTLTFSLSLFHFSLLEYRRTSRAKCLSFCSLSLLFALPYSFSARTANINFTTKGLKKCLGKHQLFETDLIEVTTAFSRIQDCHEPHHLNISNRCLWLCIMSFPPKCGHYCHAGCAGGVFAPDDLMIVMMIWWSDDDDDLMISWSVDLMIWLSDDQRVLISSVVFCKTHIQRFHFSASADNVHGFYF